MNANELYVQVLEDAVSGKGFEVIKGDAVRWDTTLEFTTPFSLNLGLMGLHQSRWRKLILDYIEPISFLQFLRRARASSGPQEDGYTFPVYAKHLRGNCLLGVSSRNYRGVRQLTLPSRTCL